MHYKFCPGLLLLGLLGHPGRMPLRGPIDRMALDLVFRSLIAVLVNRQLIKSTSRSHQLYFAKR